MTGQWITWSVPSRITRPRSLSDFLVGNANTSSLIFVPGHSQGSGPRVQTSNTMGRIDVFFFVSSLPQGVSLKKQTRFTYLKAEKRGKPYVFTYFSKPSFMERTL